MMRRAIAIVFASLALLALPAGAAGPDPWAYFGMYALGVGTTLQGGLMEEGDADVWIFASPEDQTIGGWVYRQESDTTFTSILRPGQTLTFSDYADGAYQQVALSGPDSKPRIGRRMQAFKRSDVQIPAPGGSIGASLLTPACAGPHPLVVFVNGSKYTSRHIGNFATFFLSQGLALLAYDKRDGDPEQPGWQEQSLAEIGNDAAIALGWAVKQPDVDPERAGIFGSSQGGWTGTIAAVREPGADFLIVRAGPGVSELETHLYEVRQEMFAHGLTGRDLDKAVALHREIYALAMRGEPIEATDALVAPWRDTPWYRKAFGDTPVSKSWSARWWQWAGESMAVSAIPYLERFSGPVLWFLGAEDENVPLVPSYAALTRAFAGMPSDDHRLIVLPDAPHSFVIDMHSPNAHYVKDFYPSLRNWLAEHGLSRPDCAAK